MADFLKPIKTLTIPLEEYADHPEGPAAALLDYLEVPAKIRSRLKSAKYANTGQDIDTRAQFLALNREIKDKAKLKQAKIDLLNHLEKTHG